MIKRILDIFITSLIGLGQAFLELDGIGFDAMIIGFVVIGLLQIRTKIVK
jgi:hypothetical protein